MIKTLFDWIAPSMSLDGLIVRSPWMDHDCAEVTRMFADKKLHLPATVLVVTDRHAIDYIRQAPVLVLAATAEANLVYRKERLRVARGFMEASRENPRLNALLSSYALAPQLKSLSAQLLRHDHLDLLLALSTIYPSKLAQSIPSAQNDQREWLSTLSHWRKCMHRHSSPQNTLLSWAATHLRSKEAQKHTEHLAVFAAYNSFSFNERWNYVQAKAAFDRWNTGIILGSPTDLRDWHTIIDYSPLPTHTIIGDYEFQALQTRAALFEEGEKMHNCVRVYAPRVAAGVSRIYSVRHQGKRVATLELVVKTRRVSKRTEYVLSQLKGPCNTRPRKETISALAAFLQKINSENNVAPVIDAAQLDLFATPRRSDGNDR